ncbi:MAG: hypothetical protein GXO75_12080 [Calditrichaeota bacterium]|nr:hypothetical protein [Calditrichota bacterium]
MKFKLVRLFILFLLALVSATGFAQKKEEPKKEKVTKSAEDQPNIQDKELKIFMDKIEVIGRLEKPQAVFIIPGKNPEIDDIRIRRSFFNNIFRTVEKKGSIVTKIDTKPVKDRKDYIPW